MRQLKDELPSQKVLKSRTEKDTFKEQQPFFLCCSLVLFMGRALGIKEIYFDIHDILFQFVEATLFRLCGTVAKAILTCQ